MSVLFQKPKGPTRVNEVQINQSVLGFALAVVMGKGKIQQALLWTDGFSSKKVAVGGKGFGGGKGGTQYVYSADVIAALCNGPVTAIGDAWSGQSWLSNSNIVETYVITGGTPIFTPTKVHRADSGVGQSQAYSSTNTDLGSGAPVTVSGSHIVPFRRVTYGATLATGQYSIDPATSNYHFSTADVGKTVQVAYSFALGIVTQQETDSVPAGQTISVGGSIPFKADVGVVYISGPNAGHALVKVSSSPGTGQYSVSGSGPATYHFAAGDINATVRITYKINNTAALPQGEPTSLRFTLFDGFLGQSPWALLLSNYQGAALGYTGIAYVAYGPMDLGFSAAVQQNVFEVLTPDAYGGGIVDCSPVQCILQVLTNPIWGLGAGSVPFPASAIDNGVGGTWGSLTPGVPNISSTAWSWFAANGFFISPVIDRQDTAASLISRWLDAGQCAAFMSEGLLKLVPYGDTSTGGNGAVWVAPSAFAVALDDTCFLQKNKGQDPVKISSSPWQDAYNVVQVSWNNRANQYAPEITPESDQAAINRYGSRIEDPQTWDFITTLPAATFAASMRVKRNVYTRNTYEFSLPFYFSYLEPMDVVPITTSSVWAAGLNNQNLGIINLPVRITKIVDNPDGTLDITAEDYPFGVHQPTIYNKDLAAGQVQPNKFADPGDSEVVLFEATDRLTGFQGNQIWIGACGVNDEWGSCNVLASMDGTTYKQIGTIEAPARLGVLGSAFGSGSDPDTTNSLVINLVENSAGLEAGSSADADADNTLLYVDGELVSTSAMAVTGQNQYTAGTYIRRGRMGTAIAAHSSGGLVMRIDDTVFKYTYDPSWAGKTIHLKFQSVNVHGNSAQDPSGLTAVNFTIPGLNPGTVDASTGLVVSQHLPPNVSVNVACNCAMSSVYDSVALTSSVSFFGPGGSGTSWNYSVGGVTKTYAAATITGVTAGSGPYFGIYDTRNNTFSLVLTIHPENANNDYYIVIPGSITAAASTGGGTSGGAGGGHYGCTVEGEQLDTPGGPVDNRIIKGLVDLGQPVYLAGRFGPERIVSAEWVHESEVYSVKVGDRPAFECSRTHMLRVAGHYLWTMCLSNKSIVETQDGYEAIRLERVFKKCRVLRLYLEGPGHEYSVHGVWTHNFTTY